MENKMGKVYLAIPSFMRALPDIESMRMIVLIYKLPNISEKNFMIAYRCSVIAFSLDIKIILYIIKL